MKNRIISLSILLLVSILMLASFPNDAYAKIEHDTILRIATQAHEEITIQLESLNSITPNVERLFQNGTDELDSLKEAIRNNDVQASKKHFLSAMNIFKKISYTISDKDLNEAMLTDVIPVRPDLKSELDRTEKFFINLKNIARTHNANIDFSQLDELFNLAKQQIRNGNNNNAQKSINQINELIIDINSKLKKVAQQKATDRAKDFAQQYLDRLDKIISDAEEIGYPDSIVNKLKEAKEKLSESSNPRQIIYEIKHILLIKEQFDLSKSDRITLRVNNIEEKIINLSINETDIKDAKALIAKIRLSVDEGNYDTSKSLLRVLVNMLKTLENYTQ